MKYNVRNRRTDGFFNLTAPDLPVLTEGKSEQPVDDLSVRLPPVDDLYPIDSSIYTDPAYEIDFSNLSCDELEKIISELTSIPVLIKTSDPNVVNYYQKRLMEAKQAMSNKCGSSYEILIPEPILPIKEIKQDPTSIVLPTGSEITIGPPTGMPGGSAGGGSGSGGSAKKEESKKTEWWVWAVAGSLLALSIYQTSKQ